MLRESSALRDAQLAGDVVRREVTYIAQVENAALAVVEPARCVEKEQTIVDTV